jgi:hypothetical protein
LWSARHAAHQAPADLQAIFDPGEVTKRVHSSHGIFEGAVGSDPPLLRPSTENHWSATSGDQVLAAFLGFAGEHRAGAVHHGDNGGAPADCCRGPVSIGRNGSLQVVGYFKGPACRQKQKKPCARMATIDEVDRAIIDIVDAAACFSNLLQFKQELLSRYLWLFVNDSRR